jgi:hypothetical protein
MSWLPDRGAGQFEEAITAHQDAAGILRETAGRSEGITLNSLEQARAGQVPEGGLPRRSINAATASLS